MNVVKLRDRLDHQLSDTFCPMEKDIHFDDLFISLYVQQNIW